jgi:integrase/recombinase XerD
MFKKLFRSAWAVSRHANGPLAEQRAAFLSHLASCGIARSTLLGYANAALVIAGFLDRRRRDEIQRAQLASYAQRWAKRQLRLGEAVGIKWVADRFNRVACKWCSFMGWLQDVEQSRPAYYAQLDAWTGYLRSEEALAEQTVSNYRWWTGRCLQWFEQKGVGLRCVTPTWLDRFVNSLSADEYSRATLACAAKILRRFFSFAHSQGWCSTELSHSILSPRLYQRENVPTGPAWRDVKRLIGATDGSSDGDLRNRAILHLLAVYGLRAGEVRSLRLDDVDWTRRILRVRRTKISRVHEYPLTSAASRAIRRYLRAARPRSDRPEVFLTLNAPFRPLSGGGIYGLVAVLMKRLNIASVKHGPHALRHACATYLVNNGLSLKGVGDHLGHETLSATQVYAKIDLPTLRAVAAFDLGGLV